MKRALTWVGTTLKYVAGMVCWFIIVGVLQHLCFFNLGSFIDSLWMKDLHDDVVQNVIGEVAYRASNGYGDFGRGDKYIYNALYQIRMGKYDAGQALEERLFTRAYTSPST